MPNGPWWKPRYARGATRFAAVAAVLLATLPGTAAARSTAATHPEPVAGGPGVGDRLFPYAGNSGYQVAHYDIKLRFAAQTGVINATTTLSAMTKVSLRSFHLDFHRLRIDSLTVDGRRSAYHRAGDELVIRPAHPLARHARFTVVVRYHGVPKTIIDPDGSQDGWVKTPDGADAVSEPVGAMSWFPCNNHPLDKATYRISLDVPAGLVAASNGRLIRHTTHHPRGIWVWAENAPMTSYLATVSIGRFRQVTTHAGPIRIRSFIDPLTGSVTHTKHIRNALRFLTATYGRYPFADAGIIVDTTGVGYALETQTRPTFDGGTDVQTLVHELSHQWFGDSVSLRRWQDIWLNEGFATYSEWLWQARLHPRAPQRNFNRLYMIPASSGFWTIAPDNFTDPAQLFSGPVYARGAMTLQALRDKIGSAAFFKVLRSWVRQHAYGHGTTEQFRRLAEHVSGQDLRHFFHVWLDESTKPTAW